MAYGYGYGGYPGAGGYYPPPPVPDQLAQLRSNQFQQPVQNMMQGNQPMQQPVMGQQFQQMNNANNSGILWVNSEREAVEYPVAPNSAVALWDANNPVVYLKKADASGKPDTEIYDLVKRNAAQAAQMPVQATQTPVVEYVTRADFNALAERYDEIAAELETLKNKPFKCATKKAKEDANNE